MADEEVKDRRGWHLKKELSLGDLLAIALSATALFGAYSTLDQRLIRLEAQTVFQKQIDTRQDEDSVRFQARIDEALRIINAKLDRLVERKQ